MVTAQVFICSGSFSSSFLAWFYPPISSPQREGWCGSDNSRAAPQWDLGA